MALSRLIVIFTTVLLGLPGCSRPNAKPVAALSTAPVPPPPAPPLGACVAEWREAEALLEDRQSDTGVSPFADKPETPTWVPAGRHTFGSLAAIRKHLHTQRQTLAALHRTAECLADEPFGPAPFDTQTSALMGAARLLAFEAHVAMADNDAAAMQRAVLRLLRLVRVAAGPGGDATSRLLAQALYYRPVVEATCGALQTGRLSPQQLADLEAELRGLEGPNLLLESVWSHRAVVFHGLAYALETCEVPWDCPEPEALLAALPGLVRLVVELQFALIAELERGARLGFPRTLRQFEKVSAAVPILLQWVPREFFVGMRSFPWTHARDNVLRYAALLAHRDVLRSALAIEGFRQRTGRLPDSLAEAFDGDPRGVPIDPFDGQALRYRRTWQGYRVFSIGQGPSFLGALDHVDLAARHYLVDDHGRDAFEAWVVGGPPVTPLPGAEEAEREAAHPTYDFACVVEPPAMGIPLSWAVPLPGH